MRKQVRLFMQCSELEGDSPLLDMLNKCSEFNDWIDRKSFDKWAKQSGYAPYEISWCGTRDFVLADTYH